MAVKDIVRTGLKGSIGYLITDGLGDLYALPGAGGDSANPPSKARGPGISRVTFTHGQASITVELPVTRTWAIPASGQIGQATLSLPRNSAAASATYIDPHGGSLVRVGGQNGCGDWVGIITQPKFSEAAVELTAYQPWIIFQKRFLRNGRTFVHTTPGYLFTQVWRDGAAGINAITMTHAPYEVGGPHVESFQFSGQDVWSAITSLMALSEHELHIDAVTLKADWCGSYAYTSRYPTLLIAGGNLRGVTYVVDGTSRAAEVLALDPSGKPPYRTRLGEAATAHWPAQVQVNPALGGVNLRATAEATLEKHTQPLVAVEGDLPIANWDLRERQTVQLLIPWAEFTGVCVSGRVLARTVNDATGLMHVVIQVLNAPRVDAPLVSGGMPLRGVAQQLKRNFRTVEGLNRARASVRYKVPIHGVSDATGGHVDGQLVPVNGVMPPGLVDLTGGNVHGNVANVGGAVPAALTDNTTGAAGAAVANVGAAFNQATLNNNFATLTTQMTTLAAAHTADQATLNDALAALADRINTLLQVHVSDQQAINNNHAELAASVAALRTELLALRQT